MSSLHPQPRRLPRPQFGPPSSTTGSSGPSTSSSTTNSSPSSQTFRRAGPSTNLQSNNFHPNYLYPTLSGPAISTPHLRPNSPIDPALSAAIISSFPPPPSPISVATPQIITTGGRTLRRGSPTSQSPKTTSTTVAAGRTIQRSHTPLSHTHARTNSNTSHLTTVTGTSIVTGRSSITPPSRRGTPAPTLRSNTPAPTLRSHTPALPLRPHTPAPVLPQPEPVAEPESFYGQGGLYPLHIGDVVAGRYKLLHKHSFSPSHTQWYAVAISDGGSGAGGPRRSRRVKTGDVVEVKVLASGIVSREGEVLRKIAPTSYGGVVAELEGMDGDGFRTVVKKRSSRWSLKSKLSMGRLAGVPGEEVVAEVQAVLDEFVIEKKGEGRWQCFVFEAVGPSVKEVMDAVGGRLPVGLIRRVVGATVRGVEGKIWQRGSVHGGLSPSSIRLPIPPPPPLTKPETYLLSLLSPPTKIPCFSGANKPRHLTPPAFFINLTPFLRHPKQTVYITSFTTSSLLRHPLPPPPLTSLLPKDGNTSGAAPTPAPELLTSLLSLSSSTDAFALGALLFEVVNGRSLVELSSSRRGQHSRTNSTATTASTATTSGDEDADDENLQRLLKQLRMETRSERLEQRLSTAIDTDGQARAWGLGPGEVAEVVRLVGVLCGADPGRRLVGGRRGVGGMLPRGW